MSTMNRKVLTVLIAAVLLGAAGVSSAEEGEGPGNWASRQAAEPGSSFDPNIPYAALKAPSEIRKVPQTQVIQHNFADDAYYNRQNGGVPAL